VRIYCAIFFVKIIRLEIKECSRNVKDIARNKKQHEENEMNEKTLE